MKQPKQVTVRFTKPMVSLGDIRPKVDIFQIKCPLPGSSRFLDSTTWVYEFEKELPGGVECSFQLKEGTKTLNGDLVQGERNFSFHTGGPSVQYSSPYNGASITEDQIFVLHLDAKPDLTSFQKYTYFRSEELGNRIPIILVTGSERKSILKSTGDTDREETVLLKSKQTFLPDRQIQLVLGKGTKSVWGGEIREDEILSFTVRPVFSVRFSCERVNAKADCIPILPVSLSFSSAVPRSLLQKIKLVSKDGKEYPQSPMAEKGNEFYEWVSFPGPFPENSEFEIRIPELVDDNNRSLSNIGSFPLKFKTDEFPPLAKFSAKFGILESKAKPALPVTLRNLEVSLPMKSISLGVGGKSQKTMDILEIQKWFQILSSREREQSVFQNPPTNASISSLSLPKPNGKKPMEVVGIPLETPGFYVVELASDILGTSLLEKKGKMYVSSAALVTNLSAHFKWGKDTSLVWVTNLDQGLPESGVQVKVLDCKGNLRGAGITGKDGSMLFGNLNFQEIPYCGYHELGSGLTIFVQKNDDISFTSSTWDKGVESWRYQLPSATTGYSKEIKSIVLDRTLFKKGETVHLRHVRRGFGNKGLIAADPKDYPSQVIIKHEGSGEAYPVPLVWSFPGHSESEFKIPKNAKHGVYIVYYPYSNDDSSYGETVTQFRVEEFRLPVVKGNIQLSGDKQELVSPKESKVLFGLEYLSGGGAGGFPVKIRSQIVPGHYSPKEEYSAFSFSPESIKEGKWKASGYDEEEVEESKPAVLSTSLKTDEKGFLQYKFDGLKSGPGYGSFQVEMEYADPSGEIQTVSRSFPVSPAEIHLGILPDGWLFTEDNVKLQLVALDQKDKTIGSQKIKVTAYKREFYSNRKRLVGGFYAYEHYEEVTKLGEFCEGKTDSKGILICEGKSPGVGDIVFLAETKDSSGNLTSSSYNVWVSSKQEAWFDVSDHNRMDILPEKRSVDVGETIKIQVRSPFREATALVSLEREGVLDYFVTPVSGKDPMISIPIKKEYAPNVFVSVFLVRGRVGEPKPTGLVDLAKPGYRLGLTMLKVGYKPYSLSVSVNPEKKLYQVRETANVEIEIKNSDGKVPVESTEVTLAVVDEALLELSPNPTWNLIDAMMGTRPHSVGTSTAQSQIIGKRHFGLKAKPDGGGGGKQSTRSLFDTLLYWKGKGIVGKDGKLKLSFPLNDSLTSFRIVAIATSGTKEFGTGMTKIQTTQKIQSFSGIPPVVRLGDHLRHEVTLRNAGENKEQLRLRLSVTDLKNGTDSKEELETKSAILGPGETKVVFWDLTVPENTTKRKLYLEVSAPNGTVLDQMAVEQKVLPVDTERVYQAGLFLYESQIKESVQVPEGSKPDSGKMIWKASPTILTSLSGIQNYFHTYPYYCMEQRVSKAIGLKSEVFWNEVFTDLNSFLDYDGLVKYFARMEHGSEILTAYVLTSAQLTNQKVPDDSLARMIAGLQGYVEGRVSGERYRFGADSVIRKIIVWEALTRYQTYEWEQVRPIFDGLEFLPTASLIDLSEIWGRVNGGDSTVKSRLTSVLRSRLNIQGSELVIADSGFTNPWWILGSRDYTMAKFLLWAFSEPSYKKDMPRLIKGFVKMQKRGSYDTTLGNAYSILVFDRVSKLFESEKVTGGKIKIQSAKEVYHLEPNGKQMVTQTIGTTPETVSVSYDGKGKPWVEWSVNSVLPLKAPISSGYRIKRTFEPIQVAKSGVLTKGDTIRVTLEIQADSDKTWVVIEDPIPPGSLPLGRGFGRESIMQAEGKTGDTSYYLSFEEKTLSTYRAYFEYLPKGTHTLEHSFRLNHSGSFKMPATRVEAMYSPETHAEWPNETVRISEKGD
ncbi:MG2 domain-containing protein [Leptospira sp. 2 VSF17]|uniref:MG2 domain-containing protein n=1 Tax=Leptospira soteropolitanensis TaxID=2950025 RepID=A0AAW5VLW5_9LEPT|nr:MG2 domain-containing protein [Leptospira soteropolitanensis]MCW7500217.1 MG2 domain-containing protein [Leptospira soteropolitanensis]MCW7522468.1 MG2 domain-containing protein [Leptospira soteropolitanensis]MCW7529564.1 MG2 domain-containing protein [Leptospira soteropolitanensis]